MFEYLKVRRAKDLSTLQGQEPDLMARLLQAMDCVINMKLCSLRFTKADAAFLK
jgi:hypothetical protein